MQKIRIIFFLSIGLTIKLDAPNPRLTIMPFKYDKDPDYSSTQIDVTLRDMPKKPENTQYKDLRPLLVAQALKEAKEDLNGIKKEDPQYPETFKRVLLLEIEAAPYNQRSTPEETYKKNFSSSGNIKEPKSPAKPNSKDTEKELPPEAILSEPSIPSDTPNQQSRKEKKAALKAYFAEEQARKEADMISSLSSSLQESPRLPNLQPSQELSESRGEATSGSRAIPADQGPAESPKASKSSQAPPVISGNLVPSTEPQAVQPSQESGQTSSRLADQSSDEEATPGPSARSLESLGIRQESTPRSEGISAEASSVGSKSSTSTQISMDERVRAGIEAARKKALLSRESASPTINTPAVNEHLLKGRDGYKVYNPQIDPQSKEYAETVRQRAEEFRKSKEAQIIALGERVKQAQRRIPLSSTIAISPRPTSAQGQPSKPAALIKAASEPQRPNRFSGRRQMTPSTSDGVHHK